MSEKVKEFRRRANIFQQDGNSRILRCGETIPESGIYEAIHKGPDAAQHGVSVVAVRGETVKPCVACGEEVCLRLVRSAPHISEDADFCHPRE